MKTTITFESINGYLVRLYPNEITFNTRLKYHGVLTIIIDDDVAIIKGLHGKISHKNVSDMFEYLKNIGIKVCTWERYNSSGELRSSKTLKL